MRKFTLAVLSSLLAIALLPSGVARAQDKSVDSAFHALADARTNADLALRKARELSDSADNEYRIAAQGADLARGRIADQIQKDIQAEQKKPDETRDNDKINALSERSHQIDIAWGKYANTDRPAMDQRYNAAKQLIQALSQIYNDLANLENGWKDTKLDLASLQASFDAVSKRAGEASADLQKAVDDLKLEQKTWENMPEIVAPATPPAK